MLEKIGKIKISLDSEPGIYTIYSYERLIITPESKRLITLPYRRTSDCKYINFELDKDLILNGLQVLWHNLNKKSSQTNIELILYNNNRLEDNRGNPLYQITGQRNRLDIIPNTLLGKVYFN